MFELILIPRMTLEQQKCETRAEGMQKYEWNDGHDDMKPTGGFVTSSSRWCLNLDKTTLTHTAILLIPYAFTSSLHLFHLF